MTASTSLLRGLSTSSALTFALLLSLAAPTAHALPSVASADGMDDDGVVNLRVVTDAIYGDANTFCHVQVQVAGGVVALTEGDTVTVEVRERDLWPFSDELWTTEFSVTAAEVSAGVDREFDCSGNFGDGDTGDVFEIFAVAHIRKQECGTFCDEDDPTTADIMVNGFEDDDDEPNDNSNAATDLMGGGARNMRVARNDDWYTVFTANAASLAANIRFIDAYGDLQLALFDAEANPVETANTADDDESIVRGDLMPGVYFLQVRPVNGSDFNFYDIEIELSAGCICSPGETQDEVCGRCGSRERTCTEACIWGEWSDCGGEAGVCEPGATESATCGNCGSRSRSCNESCEWGDFGECDAEGVCAPGAAETDASGCEDGERERVCSDTCEWGEFGDCMACTNDETRECYGGPAGSAGVGICAAGTQTCTDGAWGACDGEVLPALEEDCDTAGDDDCDGEANEGCEVVVELEPLGGACAADEECAGGDDAVCVTEDRFPGGYCSIAPCPAAGCGTNGRCVPFGNDEACMRRCNSDADCREDYVCDDRGGGGRSCLPPCEADNECTKDARPVCDAERGLCGPAPVMTGCQADGDCAAGQVCRAGNCVPGEAPPDCTTDGDCAPGRICENGECVEQAAPPCSGDNDCIRGQICAQGSCVIGCRDADDCDPNEQCVGGTCTPTTGNNGGNNGGDNGATNGGAKTGDGGGCAQSAGDASAMLSLLLAGLWLASRRRR